MSDIYVTGHRNPDTDSIVAALAYANLQNALGERSYKAVRLGAVTDETARLLKRFDTDAPPLVKNMRTQVADLDYDRTPALDRSVPMDLAWRTMRDVGAGVVPIVERGRQALRHALRGRHRVLRYADHHAEPHRQPAALQPSERARGHACQRAQLRRELRLRRAVHSPAAELRGHGPDESGHHPRLRRPAGDNRPGHRLRRPLPYHLPRHAQARVG